MEARYGVATFGIRIYKPFEYEVDLRLLFTHIYLYWFIVLSLWSCVDWTDFLNHDSPPTVKLHGYCDTYL